MFQIGETVVNVKGPSTAGDFDLQAQPGRSELQNKKTKDCSARIRIAPREVSASGTIEALDFTAGVPQFEALIAMVIGVSRDSVKTHEGFCARQELGIELVSDKSEELCTAFDVIKPKVMYGKPCRGIVRSTFLIDPLGKLAFEWRGVKVPGHVEAVLEKIRELS